MPKIAANSNNVENGNQMIVDDVKGNEVTKAATKQMNATNIRNKFMQLEAELNQCVLERKDVIRGSLIALLTSSNLLQLGEPGTAKSYITRLLARTFSANYFQYLLGKNTNPDELFGPVSLTGLRQDKFIRITEGRAPTAHIIFYDETFKGSSAILNANLTLANEHMFDDGTGLKKTPLISLFGASNELPEANSGLEAMYDRFLIRFWVEYLEDAQNFAAMLAGTNMSEPSVQMSLEELYFAQEQVKQVEVTQETILAMVKVRNELLKQRIRISDRRFKDCVKLLRANAWLNGQNETSSDDIEFLENSLWIVPEQIDTVRTVIAKVSDPIMAQVRVLYKDIKDKYEAINKNDKDSYIEFLSELKNVAEEFKKQFKKSGGTIIESGNTDTYKGGNQKIADLIEELRNWRLEIRAVIKGE